MNLHQKLVAIRSDIGGFTKDTKGYNYSYVSGTQVLAKIQQKMNELGVLLVPKVATQDFKEHSYTDSKGKQKLDFLVFGEMSYTWINADDPSDFLEVPFYYTGAQDDISKAFGSGLTYSERYFVIKFFNLPTDADDPDKRDTSGRSKPYNNQQPYNNQKPQQQPPRQQPQNTPPPGPPPRNGYEPPPVITPAQTKALKAKLNNVANAKKQGLTEVLIGAFKQLGIPEDLNPNTLTKPQASKVIEYLATVEPK